MPCYFAYLIKPGVCEYAHQSAEEGEAIAVRSCGAKINVSNGSYDVRCLDSKEAELIAIDGNVEVSGEDWKSTVRAGSKIRLSGGKIVGEVRVDHPMIETRWIHELLREKSPEDAEVMQRVDQLWASIGFSKMQHLHEEELRTLGTSCVRPLMAFLKSGRAEHQAKHRRSGGGANFSCHSRMLLEFTPTASAAR